MSLLKESLKKLARFAISEYSIYYIYANNIGTSVLHDVQSDFKIKKINKEDLLTSTETLIRDQENYLGNESSAYACFLDDEIVGVCIYWFGERYKKRNFWKLDSNEAKLVQIVTIPKMRGKGVATKLIASSCNNMVEQGFSRTYARIWHSNRPSLRAFERANWIRIALVIEINPFRRKNPTQIRIKMD